MNFDHHVYINIADNWIKRPSKPQLFISLIASTNVNSSVELGLELLAEHAHIHVTVMPDTDYQSCLAGMKILKSWNVDCQQEHVS